MPQVDRTVVRNQTYKRTGIVARERHNERKNECYANEDVDLSQSHLNVHFKSCEGTYTQAFDSMVETGEISTRGLKPDANVIDEFVFDVNSNYFERNGGYDYAKSFFEEAYQLAVKEAGGEQYILSAVMHADERNKALSEQYGHDVYHYHLHVVYIPIVTKVVKWTKRCKDPALVGTTKEVVRQVSHSKKWASNKVTDEHGKSRLIRSYSLLQDRFFEHMRDAGFDGFERGERGSTAEHLSVLEYKTKAESKRLGDLSKQTVIAKAEVERYVEATKVRANISATQTEIDGMARPGKSGNNKIVSNADWEVVSTMAKRCALLDAKMKDMQTQITSLQRDRDKWKNNYTRLLDEVKEFIGAIRSIPNRLREFIAEHMPGKSKNREVGL